MTSPNDYTSIDYMKIARLVQISLTISLLTSCSTFKQADGDFKNFYNTIVYYNFPSKREGWNATCDYCIPKQKCKWNKCANKNK